MSFFWRSNCKLKQQQKKGWRTASFKTSPLYCLQNFPSSIMHIFTFKRRIPLFPSSGSSPSIKGSLSVETALSLPLFFFFCIQLLSVISLFQLHSSIEAALHQTVREMGIKAYAVRQIQEAGGKPTDESSGGEILDGLTDESGENGMLDTLLEGVGGAYIKARIIEKAGREYLDKSMIQGGSQGLQIADCRILADAEEVIQVEVVYSVKPLINIMGFPGFSMGNVCRMKAWTGYAVGETTPWEEGGEGEEIVYITETGSVYHRDRSCSHLLLSIQAVSQEAVGNLRNGGGAKYYPCETCHPVAGAESVYITEEGDRYHSGLHCSGLKRTIYTIPISRTGGRGPCSRCGGM